MSRDGARKQSSCEPEQGALELVGIFAGLAWNCSRKSWRAAIPQTPGALTSSVFSGDPHSDSVIASGCARAHAENDHKNAKSQKVEM